MLAIICFYIIEKISYPNCAKRFRKHAMFLYIHIIKYIYNISIMPLSLRIMCFLENVLIKFRTHTALQLPKHSQ